jgi:SAM-dependent methyltransferase
MNTSNQETSFAQSPLSTLPPKKIRDLSKRYLLEQLELYYKTKPPAEIVDCDYSLWECVETGLQFGWPPTPGNPAYYEWISGFASYYPGSRWEYGEVRRLLATGKSCSGPSRKALDVGSGKGDFLRTLDCVPSAGRFALDFNESAIQACRQQGFQAFCGTIEAALAGGFFKAGDFATVTAFHCLEHVSQPVEFIRALLKTAGSGGRVFASTPYSPMSFESVWFDVMNHPPHHLTRWNLKAYRRLADILGVKMRHYVPPCPPLQNTMGAFRLKQYGPHRHVGKKIFLKDLLLNFNEFLMCYRTQRQRARTNGANGANTILVEFIVPQ